MASLLPTEAALIVGLHEDVTPGEYPLQDDTCSLGRSPTCHVVVQRNVVSRLHARIKREGPRYMLYDESSINGTFVNSRRITTPHLLKNRDLIGLGAAAAVLRFVDPDPTELSTGSLRYDDQALRFFLKDQLLALPPALFRLLLHLYRHQGTVCSRESCAEAIWSRAYNPGMDADALDRVVSNLRRFLRDAHPAGDEQPELIVNRRGLGYELVL